MMCTEYQYEDANENIVVYRDEGINTEEYENAMYGNLMKTHSEEETEVKCNVALCANDIVSLERKKKQPMKNVHNVSQSDTLLNENPTGNSFNNLTTMEQGTTDDDDENESWKAWTMEMLMVYFDISMTTMNGPEQMREDYKKFLYTRATHSNHLIQYHMQQILERQKVVNEYRSMTMEGMGLTPIESNLHKNIPVVISQIIQMIEVDNFWNLKTFEAVLTDLRRRWDEVIHKQKDVSTHCTENSETNDEMEGIEVIRLCSKNLTRNSEFHDGTESTNQGTQDKMKSKTIARMESKNQAWKIQANS